MSKTYRNQPRKNFIYHRHRDWKQSQLDDYEGLYKQRPRHDKGNLISSWDDNYRGIWSDKFSTNPERKQKIKRRMESVKNT